ncbi:hypothetical protein Aph01nite_10460 [Acrocarpospora phusangensis]|uniref:Uncharacterized protein n=1 Tax=Acrocarpospora phusangensis TaxID=1070424 RepID=A0A919Q5X7_9ACTN|nr:hypothetical protein [Acrocarpospora phusangensis]GIH22736.1 hypothetical protein Aph01nite_10460 [Acrocarpospora phusangensis]
MEARIRVTADDSLGELIALTGWLNSQRALQGRVRQKSAPIGEQELGAATDILTVALGSGGIGIALVQALKVWLANRHSDVSITVTTETGSVSVEAKRVADALPLLERVLAERQPDQLAKPRPELEGGDDS